MRSVPTREVAALVNCLACATDPTRSLSLDVRRRHLLEALARLTGADAWIWIGGPLHDRGGIADLQTLDGGWRDNRERLRALQELGQPAFQPLLDAAMRKRNVDGAGCSTTPASDDAHAPPSSTCRLTLSDFSDLLTATCPAPSASNCLIGLLRRSGAAPFLERDRTIAELIVQNVPWLHVPQAHAAGIAAGLSPREREVIDLLLKGCARKEVAAALNLSSHTIADYVKGIYKKFGVKSRAELLSKYIPPDALRRS